MTKKRIAGLAAVFLLVLAGLIYHFVLGFVEVTKIDEKITVLTRKSVLYQIGANVILYTDPDDTFVIDTQLPPLGSLTRSKIDGLALSPISKVVITHWHPDHSGGISAFSSGADVLAHENVKRRLSDTQEGFGLTNPGSHHEFAARTADGLPTQTVSSDPLRLGPSSGAFVVHYPDAHTDGDLVVYFPDRQLAVIGDLIWPGSFPFVDVHNGGSVQGLESALTALLRATSPEYRFIPGHGPPLTFQDLETYLVMVSESRQWVEVQLQDGRTVDHLAASSMPADWEVWSSDLVPSAAWIRMVAASSAIATTASKQ